MLHRLEISNYALIENVKIEFDKGFTVITGETGAGKSILLKALNLLLGERADISVLKQSDKKCFLEAEFKVDGLQLESFFESNDLDFEEHSIIRREFTASGKSRCFINDSPVQMSALKALGERLVNIHSQHQTLSLFDKQFQTEVLDYFAGISTASAQYKKEFSAYRALINERIELQIKDKENRKEKDYLEFLINELKAADLENTDLDRLKTQADKLENAEKISEALGLANSVFNNETYGPHNGIKTLLETFEELKNYDLNYADMHARLLSLKIELDDIQNEVDALGEQFDLGEIDVQAVKDKMDLMNSLLFKHNLTEIADLLQLQADLEGKMAEIVGFEDKLAQIELDIDAKKKNLEKEAKALSASRKKASPELCKAVHQILQELSMDEAELNIELTASDQLTSFGFDDIQFLFKTNKGGQSLPLKKIASGGELSRLMLAIMSILSEKKNLPTLIFDEIDTGVSGEVAAKIGKEFQKMGQHIQLIAITHLPQVAAKGTEHLHVAKSSGVERTTTQVIKLNAENRINELAKMISGEEITSAAKENAQNLLNIS